MTKKRRNESLEAAEINGIQSITLFYVRVAVRLVTVPNHIDLDRHLNEVEVDEVGLISHRTVMPDAYCDVNMVIVLSTGCVLIPQCLANPTFHVRTRRYIECRECSLFGVWYRC